jgi:hypothetical protein
MNFSCEASGLLVSQEFETYEGATESLSYCHEPATDPHLYPIESWLPYTLL